MFGQACGEGRIEAAGVFMAVGSRAVAALLATAAVAMSALVASGVPAAPSAANERIAVAAQIPAAWAPAAAAPIRPGVLTETAGGGLCTSNFVFVSGERTFLGQAAHCAGTGPDTETDGCTSSTGPLGSTVTVLGTDGSRRIGRLAYSSWITMQAGGETDRATCAANDFALVELDPADAAAVNPSVPFFGGPTGLATEDLGGGDEVLGYGSPVARLGRAALTARIRPKVGIESGRTGAFAHDVLTLSPGVPGDSGAGYLTADGRAFGLLTTLTVDGSGDGISDGVTDLAAALGYANANGGLGEVQLVLGTEPFTAYPPGIPATELVSPAGPPAGG